MLSDYAAGARGACYKVKKQSEKQGLQKYYSCSG
jgi:hypothetical protein